MIPVHQFRRRVIRPVLDHLAKTEPRLDSGTAENLLLGTAIMESRLADLEQIDGPAVSMFQVEPTTFEDVYERYLWRQRRDLYMAVKGFRWPAQSPLDQLPGNQHFACAVARIKYWMVPDPLPEDIDGLGQYWKAHYNAGGRGTGAQWAMLFRKYVKERR